MNTPKQLYIPLALLVVCYSMILIRLFVIQQRGPKLYEHPVSVTMKEIGYRSAIYDRNGIPLAYTAEQLSAFIDRNHLSQPEKTVALLKREYPLAYATYKQEPEKKFIWISHGISWDDLLSLRKKSPDVHGTSTPLRLYTQPHLPHIVGCVNKELSGVSGTEHGCNNTLFEHPRTVIVEPTSHDEALYHVSHVLEQAPSSSPVTLSVDRLLQYRVTRLLHAYKEKIGCQNISCLIMNPESGEILTAAQLPTFNPHYPEQFSRERRTNTLTARSFEFGSLMHLFAGLAYLQEHGARAETMIAPSTPRHEDKGTLPETEKSLIDVIKTADKYGLCSIAKTLGIKLFDHYVRLGFLNPLTIELPETTNSFVLTPESWNSWTAYLMTFGYQQKITPLHIANALSLIANNGTPVRATLLKKKLTQHSSPLYPVTTIANLKKIMHACALEYGIVVPDHEVYAKYGCSYKTAQHIARHADVHTVGGIIEKEHYKRVIFIMVEDPESPSVVAKKKMLSLFSSIGRTVARYEQTGAIPPFIYPAYLPRQL